MNNHKVVFLSVTLCVGLASPAYAYLDPGTGSMILQGLIGGIAAGAAVISVYFQKIKAFFSKVQGRSDGAKGPTEHE